MIFTSSCKNVVVMRREGEMDNLHVDGDISDLVDSTLDSEEVDCNLLGSIRGSDVLATWGETDGGNESATLWHSLLLHIFGGDSIPNANKRFLTVLSRGDHLSVSTETESSNVIRVTVLGLIVLLSSSEIGLSTTIIKLFHILVVKHDSNGGSWIDSISFTVELAVLSSLLTSVTVDPVHAIILRWSLLVWLWMVLWLFDGSEPWFDSGKLVTFTWWNLLKDGGKDLVIDLGLLTCILLALGCLHLVLQVSLCELVMTLIT